MEQEKNTTALNEQVLQQEILESNEALTLDLSNLSLAEILQKFIQMVEADDKTDLLKYGESYKAAFYKVLNENKEQGESNEDSVSDEEVTFKEFYAQYKELKQKNAQEQEKAKEENYLLKLKVIEELKSLLESTEDLNTTRPAFRELQARWKSIDMVPQSKVKELWDTYQHCVEKFYDYIKINNEFRDLDFKKNLEAKTLLCEKAEALEQEGNIVIAFKELQKLHQEWKELGPVAKEHREAIWDRFKSVTSVINKKHQSFFEKLKGEQKNNLEAKILICEQAEKIASVFPDESSEWNTLSKQMEDLQEKWKTIGFAAKKDNQKIYDRFREACDKFYNSKREYYANFKNVMQDNLKRKEQLCEQAEALMNSEDWKKATDQLINLQKLWKEVGPVARKQSDIVWKRFRAACDYFFERKSAHFGKVDEGYGNNLKAKQDLIAEIKNYKLSDSKEDNTLAMREFQNRWNEIGFVPFADKEKVQQEFNAAMDAHFADIRSLDSEKKLNKFKKMVMEVKNSSKGSRGLKAEREKLMNKYRKIEQDIATFENNIGFFSKSKGADALISDVKRKVAIAKEELIHIEEKIQIIDKQFE
ncbi:MAG: DUF349 domain-containing protein [Bacteroidales bacterium]|nr:DUF349 domain-containing protein [Bacteroidales bacterium]